MAGVAFMNIVRWNIAEDLKTGTGFPVHVTNGSMTRTMRKYSCIEKSHANDADMGRLPSCYKAEGDCLQKHRRDNNRILEKFYDAKYMDVRDRKDKSGQQLSCGRTKQCGPRHLEKTCIKPEACTT